MIAIKTRLTTDGSFPITFWLAEHNLTPSFDYEEDENVVTQLARHDRRGIEVTYAFHPSKRDLATLFKLTFGSN